MPISENRISNYIYCPGDGALPPLPPKVLA